MPEDAPGTCVGEEAAQVAAYIYDAFYSPIAQARSRHARIELCAPHRPAAPAHCGGLADRLSLEQRLGQPSAGLKGEYYQKEWHNDKKFERIDPVVKFDFGVESPSPDQIKAEEFSVRWSGSVYAPETGEYTFIVESENSRGCGSTIRKIR